MIHRVLAIGRWVVDFLFAIDDYDEEGVLSCLYDIDSPYYFMRRASKIMEGNKPNRGFTFSNENIRRAVVVIGPTTSGKQFQNTFVHEMRHLVDAISHSLGIKRPSETSAYMSGDAAMALADVVCSLGCGHCRD